MVVPSLSLDHFQHITRMLVMVLTMDPANNTELMLVAMIMGLTLAGVFTIPRWHSFFDKQLDLLHSLRCINTVQISMSTFKWPLLLS